MKRLSALFLMFCCAAPVSAASVTFGASWDGNPPGTLADIFELPGAEAGAPDFIAGNWIITVDGGFSALVDQDIVGFEGDSFCAHVAQPCTLQHAYVSPASHAAQSTVLQVYMDRPWHLTGWSPNVGHVTSNGSQFAIAQTGPTTWTWGFEDLRAGDWDFNDIYGTLRYLGPRVDPIPPSIPAAPVPEASTGLLVALGGILAAVWRRP